MTTAHTATPLTDKRKINRGMHKAIRHARQHGQFHIIKLLRETQATLVADASRAAALAKAGAA